MLRAARAFRKNAEIKSDKSTQAALWLSDNFYILERCASQSYDECRRIYKTKKGSERLPGLFNLCRRICQSGSLPDEKGLMQAFSHGLECFEMQYLPLALTCAIVEYAYEGLEKRDSELIANAVSSLRRMGEIDFELIYSSLSKTEKLLNADPSGVYPELDENTKSVYRKAVASKAEKRGMSEEKFTAEILIKAKENSKHVGEYIFSHRKNSRKGYVFLIMELIMPFFSAFSAAVLSRNAFTGILLIFPFRQIFRFLIDSVVSETSKPIRLMRLKNSSEKVLNAHTLITVSTLLPSAEKMQSLEKHLEKLYLSNCGGKIKICCLADFKGADVPSKPEDKTAVRAAMQLFDRLNKRYSGGFILAVRPRVFSETQNEFTGKERKRGAITELIKAIKGDAKGFSIVYGDKENLTKVKYLIALDADTNLDFDAAKELISIAEHPLNRPVADLKKGRVVSGYGIITPRVENRIDYGSCTSFEKLMAGSSGVSVYDSLCVEKYQSLFGESIFCGKGLIDVEAYHLLMQDLPKEKVLSHDIIESGYLRTGFASDVKITESFPKSTDSYFSRLHRWVRGDWQNIIFIFGKNPLSFVSRFKLFDNLIRSLSTFLCLVSITASMFIGGRIGIIIAGFSALAIVFPELVSGIGSLMKFRFFSFGRLYYSNSLPSALSAFARAFLLMSLCASESLVSLDACAKALWRLFVSKKNLLQWTTAANSERNQTFAQLVLSCLPSAAVFIALFALGSPFHRLLAIIILSGVPISLISGNETRMPREQLSDAGREKLLEYAGAMWGFFDEHCCERTNYLPPDNIQLSPKGAIAKQTSPTNIGLMLLSFLAARDFGFITSKELCQKLDRSLKTVEKLEKYRGNLYNWYNVCSCEVLKPRFISTVDSGNFLCCLTSLKEGLKEYLSECPQLRELIIRINKLINETELAFLYNKQKKLFYIGMYPESGEKSESCYDLFMSEARMTSYFAVARRIVPKNHWAALGRILVSQGRYGGLVSWTGTMFEYFMPEIFIPSPKGSISYESLCFCLQCQRKRAGGRPFGASESGFYAFDGALNYQYKAHGVQKIGLRRGLNDDFVISPYSSFLTLTTAPDVSIKNLIRLEKLGAFGKYGFYEAVDYTPGRLSGRKENIVRSFMAHHVGMSFLAADNMLNGRCIQRRFMNDRFMKGAESLLDEQILPDSEIFKDVKHRETPKIREKTSKESSVFINPSVQAQNAAVYSNGRLSSCITDYGCGFLMYDGIDVTVRSIDALERPQGIFGVLKTEKEVIPFVSALNRGEDTVFTAEFGKDRSVHTAVNGDIRLEMKTSMLSRECCELRSFTVENKGKDRLKGKLIICFEPCLGRFFDFSAHPAFSRLFLTDEKDEENNCIITKRRSGSSERSFALAAGILEKAEVALETSRERALTTPEGVFSIGRKTDFTGKRGNPDCCCAFSIEIELNGKEKNTFTLATAVGDNEAQAYDSFLTVKAGKNDKRLAETLTHSDEAERIIMKSLLPSVIFPKSLTEGRQSGELSAFSKADLWSFGISGDLPVILVEISSAENIDHALPYIRIGKSLRSCGIDTDTVICHSVDEGYNASFIQALRKLLKSESCELMLGVKGGFHAVNLRNYTPKEANALRSVAVIKVKDGKTENSTHSDSNFALKRIKAIPSEKADKKAYHVKRYNFTNNKISIKKDSATVDIPWNMVLANQSFGTMVSDKVLGFTWALNSRENKLTPWYNDTSSDNRGEILIMNYKGAFYDLAALGEAVFTPEKAVWKVKIDGINFTVIVSIPERGMAKRISVEAVNLSAEKMDFDLMYYTLPVLSHSKDVTADFSAEVLPSGAVIKNSFAEIGGFSALQCSEKPDYICFSRLDFHCGRFDSRATVPSDPCCAIGRKISLVPKEKKSMNFYLSWGATESAAIKMPFCCDFEEITSKALRISTANKNLDLFFNSFLYFQIKKARFFGRTGPYQCSGAYGFRDQLQDSLAFLYSEPELCKRHILRCCAAQFEKGDVLHWWHVITNNKAEIKGIRTKCSDDMLWLPYVCSEYIKKTGDWSILDVRVPYIYGEELAVGEKECYQMVTRTSKKVSVLEHCIKATDYSLRFGENGFPLIGSCDWNDGFNNIGSNEKGESVWLAMFQIIVLEKMSQLCKRSQKPEKTNEYFKTAQKLRETVEDKAWTGERYARAILKDGSFLGADDDFIDILPQAFAAFAKLKNAETAVKSAYEKLFDAENHVIRLLAPPFNPEDFKKIGYIGNYPDGIRENGGQYTHAAVWLAMAMFDLGMNEQAKSLVNAINPLNFYEDEKLSAKYRAEPYVLAGDVSYGENIIGRAGWTHFTGSAAWLYRCIVENQHHFAPPKK